MIYNHKKQFQALSDKVVDGISQHFPVVGPTHTLEAENVRVVDRDEDYVDQLKSRLAGRDWSVPIKADLKLIDSQTGRILDRKEGATLASLPKTTSRFSYIVGGNEYQADHVWRRRPGVYAHIKENGEMESEFHLKGKRFNVVFDPASKKYMMGYGGSNVPLYPVMKAIGITDDKLKASWGKDIFEINSKEDEGKALRKLHKAITGNKGTEEEGASAFLTAMAGMDLDPEVAQLTIGKPHTKVNSEVMLTATSKLLSMSRGEAPPDPREAIMFKSLHGLEDDLNARLIANKGRLTKKIKNNLERKDRLSDIMSSALFTDEIRSVFTKSGIANTPSQLNPLDMLEGATRTTILGPGGISSEKQITTSTRTVDPSHLGFLDPMATPEGKRVGIISHLPAMNTREGTTPMAVVYSLKEGKKKGIPPAEFYHSKVVMPDEVTWEGGRPKAKKGLVSVAGTGNQFTKIPLSKADYVMIGPQNMFDIATNMIPLLQNTDNARANMASRHMVQAVGLKDPDVPLVMSKAGEYPKGNKFPWDKAPGWSVSTYATEDGVVTEVSKDYVHVKGKDGKTKKYSLYNDFPLNTDGAYITSKVKVKVGDKVKSSDPQNSDLLADSNFTKDGLLALGRNLRVGYLPIPGKTFEDALVVSESAAKKLSSEHIYKKEVGKDPNTITDKNKYKAYYPTNFKIQQLDKLDAEGIAQVGQVIDPGDPIMVSIRKAPITSETKMMARLHKSLVKPYADQATISEYNVPATVVRVHKDAKKVSVFLKTNEPAKPGDKLSGRAGNKGVIGTVMPDHEMPTTGSGRPLEVVINPQGVPSRMNPSQIYELALGKIAEKTGKPYILPNFAHDDYNKFVKDELKFHGLTDKEEVFDAKSGRSIGRATVGPVHIIKQKHLAEKKLSVREGGPGTPYDIDRIPFRGGKESAQALAQLDQYALLASGATATLREAHTLRSDQDQAQELWRAIQSGAPLPPPKVPFTYKKFEAYLQGLGVNLDKEGGNFRLVPASDKDVLAVSSGPVKNASMLRAKDLKEEEGGLFDKTSTGGREGMQWAHYKMAEPLPNPVMESAMISVAGITAVQMKDVLAGRMKVGSDGKLITEGEGLVGGAGIKKMLKAVDVNKDIKALEIKIPKLSIQLRDKANKRLRYLRALRDAGKTPEEAYLMQNLPILPPTFRPINVLASGDLRPSDINELYRGVILSSEALKKSTGRLPEEEVNKLRAGLYNELTYTMGVGTTKKRVQGGELRGILNIIHGDTSPKEGFMHSKMMKKRVDLSARAVIVPDIDLTMDEIGLPRKVATGIYKPFVVRELTRLGYTPLQAQDLVKQDSSIAKAALDKAMRDRPVLAKRDPVLHKYGIMGFKPRIVSGNAIHIHPLVTGPLNADHDGDSMAVYAPITQEAVKESWTMMPSNNLFSPASGKTVFAPTNEALLGLYKMSEIGNAKAISFTSGKDAIKAMDKGLVSPTDPIKLGKINTTAGRVKFYEALPESVRSTKMLTDPTYRLTSKKTQDLLQEVGKASPSSYATVARNLLNMGNEAVYYNANTLGIDDFAPDKKSRTKGLDHMANVLAKAGNKATIETLKKAMAEAEVIMQAAHTKSADANPTNLHIMHQAGVKPGWSQYKQLIMAPGLMEDMPGRVVPHPVTKSFGEGLDLTGYWIKSFGARKGMIDKSLEVSEPGALTKRMVNTAMDMLVTNKDCGTHNGEIMSVMHSDVIDRFAASSVAEIGLKRGQVINPAHVAKAKAAGISTVNVRSPHKCEESEGVCSKCYGLNENGVPIPSGTNIGVIAGQSIGERGTQLTMRTFHTGGVVGGGGTAVSAMNRVQNLMYLPKTLRDSSTLSTVDGKVTGIDKDPAGGNNVFVNGVKHYVPARLGVLPGIKKGSTLQKGAPVSKGVLNPHNLLPIVGMDQTRNAIADELDGIYSSEGIRRRNIEIMTRALTNLGEVQDPGSDLNLIAGDVVRLSKALADNKKQKRPAKITPILKGIEQIPHDQTEDWVARLNHTHLRDTIREAITKGFVSKLHSLNPIPSLVHGAQFGLGDGINY